MRTRLVSGLVICLAVLGCKSSPPGAVNLTIVADPSLGDATVAAIHGLVLSMSGADVFSQSYAVSQAFAQGRQERVTVRPAAKSGTLTIAVLAQSSTGIALAYGSTQVSLRSDAAVAAQVTLTASVPMPDGGFYDLAGANGLTIALVAGRLGGKGTADATGQAARFNGPRGAVVDSGNLYVADMRNHTIRKIVIATGAVSTLAGAPMHSGSADGAGTAARFSRPHGLASDGAGNLYVAEVGNCTIRKIVIATATVSTIAGSAGTCAAADSPNPRFDHPHGLVYDGAGNLYIADTKNNTIRKLVLASGAVSTIAGTAGQKGQVDMPGASARFDNPHALTLSGGKLYVADQNNNAIRQIDLATTPAPVTTFAGSASGAGGHADGNGNAASFNGPRGVVADGAGNLYVADSRNNRVRKIVVSGAVVTTVAGHDWGSSDGVGVGAAFATPFGIAFDGGNLYVTDSDLHDVRKVVLASAAVSTFAGIAGGDGLTDGAGAAARFSRPHGLSVDGNALYVADRGNDNIRKIDLASSAVTTVAGNGQEGAADGTGALASFKGPLAVEADHAGTLYVSDNGNQTIRAIDLATSAVTTLAGAAGMSGYTEGVGAAARFHTPAGLAFASGKLYVADANNSAIRVIDVASRTVSTLAGGTRGSRDDTGTAAQFGLLHGLSFAAGALYVADQGNCTIRKIDVATRLVTTIAGSAGVCTSSDGNGNAAHFNAPHAVLADASGNLYIADTIGQTVRKMVLATGAVTTIAGAFGVGSVALGPAPGLVNTPDSFALGPDGALLFTTVKENAVLSLR